MDAFIDDSKDEILRWKFYKRYYRNVTALLLRLKSCYFTSINYPIVDNLLEALGDLFRVEFIGTGVDNQGRLDIDLRLACLKPELNLNDIFEWVKLKLKASGFEFEVTGSGEINAFVIIKRQMVSIGLKGKGLLQGGQLGEHYPIDLTIRPFSTFSLSGDPESQSSFDRRAQHNEVLVVDQASVSVDYLTGRRIVDHAVQFNLRNKRLGYHPNIYDEVSGLILLIKNLVQVWDSFKMEVDPFAKGLKGMEEPADKAEMAYQNALKIGIELVRAKGNIGNIKLSHPALFSALEQSISKHFTDTRTDLPYLNRSKHFIKFCKDLGIVLLKSTKTGPAALEQYLKLDINETGVITETSIKDINPNTSVVIRKINKVKPVVVSTEALSPTGSALFITAAREVVKADRAAAEAKHAAAEARRAAEIRSAAADKFRLMGGGHKPAAASEAAGTDVSLPAAKAGAGV